MKSISTLLTTLALTLPLAGAKADTFIFLGGAAGYPNSWFNRTNWGVPPDDEMASRYPVPSDTIIIRGTVDIPDWTFPDLRLAPGGAIRGSFTVGGTLLWTGGTLAVGGTVTVPSNAIVNMAFTEAGILSGSLVNQGTIHWPTGSWSAVVFNGGHLDNMPGGVMDIQLDADFQRGPSGPGVFNNAGTFRKSGSGHVPVGSDWAQFRPGMIFNNTGLVDLQSGTLRFTDGFTSSGLFAVATNTFLQLTGGTFHLLPGHLFIGPGTYGVVLGPVVIDGPITEPNFRLGNGSLTMSNQITGTLLWDGYATLAGEPTIASNGVLKIVNPPGGFPVTLRGVLTNHGLFLWPSNTYSSIVFDNARLENMPGALVDMQLDGSWHRGSSGPGVFNNRGTFCKSGSGGGVGNTWAQFQPGFQFNNSGWVDLQNGTLRFTDGFTSSSLFSVPTNTAVELHGGIFHFLPGHLFSGQGTYGANGSVVIDGPITEPNFQFTGSSLTISNQITGTLVWRQGALGGAPTIARSGVVRYVAGSGQWLSAGALTNHGLFLWPTGAYAAIFLSNGRLENMPDGVVDMQVDGGFYSDGSSAQVNNAGVFRKSTGSGIGKFVGNVGFLNTGLLDVQSGTLQVPNNSLMASGRLNCGLRSPSDYGRVVFDGSGVLNGTLSASLMGGFLPMAGERYEVVTSGGLSGGFTTLSLPDHFFTTNTPGSVFLVIGSGGPVTLIRPAVAGTNFMFAFQSEAGSHYSVEYNDDLGTANWLPFGALTGDGSLKWVIAPRTNVTQRFFRLHQP